MNVHDKMVSLLLRTPAPVFVDSPAPTQTPARIAKEVAAVCLSVGQSVCLSFCLSICFSDNINLKVSGAAVVFVDSGVYVAFVGEILDGFAYLLLREFFLGELLKDVADWRPALSVLAQRTDVSQNLVLHSRQPLHRRRS